MTFRYVKPNSSVEEIALRIVVAHLRSTNPSCSEVYREKKTASYNEYTTLLSTSRELSALLKKRGDKSQTWTAEEENTYLALCRKFDELAESN